MFESRVHTIGQRREHDKRVLKITIFGRDGGIPRKPRAERIRKHILLVAIYDSGESIAHAHATRQNSIRITCTEKILNRSWILYWFTVLFIRPTEVFRRARTSRNGWRRNALWNRILSVVVDREARGWYNELLLVIIISLVVNIYHLCGM